MGMMTRDPVGSFKTYANHLRAFAVIAGKNGRDRTSALNETLRRIRSSGFLPTTRYLGADLRQVRASLQNAWGTELLLVMSKRFMESEEMIRLSNNWSVVQAYYVLYHATQAIVVAKGFPRPESHPKTQKQFHNLFANRGSGLEPWTMAFGYDGPQNVPPNVQLDHRIHSWSICNADSCWSLAFKSLRTAREDATPEQEQKAREEKRGRQRRSWQEEERGRRSAGRKPRKEPEVRLPRLTSSEKMDVSRSHRPFTLIDFLYRLRVRTNYEDSAMFTDGPEQIGQSEVVRDDLLGLVATSLLVAELYVRQLVGDTEFDGWVKEWVEGNARFTPPIGVAERMALHGSPLNVDTPETHQAVPAS